VKEKTAVLKTGAYEKPQIPTAPVSGVLGATVSPTTTATPSVTDPSALAAGKIGVPGSKPLSNPATNQGNQLLNFRSSQQVWGKKVEPPVTTTPDPSTAAASTAPSTAPTTAPVAAPVVKAAPVVAAPVVPQLSEQALKEKAQKEKMAAGLFGGISASSKPVGIKSKTNIPAATPLKPSASKGSLIDTDSPLISVTPTQPVVQAPPAKPATMGGLFDSMEVKAPTVPSSSGGGLMTWGSPAPAPAATTPVTPSIFASPVAYTPASVAAQPSVVFSPIAPAAPSSVNLFDGMLSPAPAPVSVATPASGYGGGLLDMHPVSIKPSVSVDSFDSSGTPHSGNVPLYTPASVPTPAPAPVMAPQSSVGGGLAAISIGMNPIFIKPNTVTDAFADMTKLSLEPTTASISQSNNINISTGIPSASSTTGGLLLHPLKITTQEFGQKWGQLAAEVKGSCASNISTLAQLSAAIPPMYHNVESIHATNESIFAASANIGSVVVLVHLKVQTGRKSIDITVKSTTRQICADLLKSITTDLSAVV